LPICRGLEDVQSHLKVLNLEEGGGGKVGLSTSARFSLTNLGTVPSSIL
jgi:hypothetical protein